MQPIPNSKEEDRHSKQPAPPPLDRQAVVKAEIDALERESIAIAQELIEDFPHKTDPLGLMGMVYNRCDQTAKALEYWQQALNRNSNRPDLYDAMATVALRRGENEKAADLCRKGLEKSFQMPHLHYQLADALNGMGQAEEAMRKLQIAITQAPDTGEIYCLLGKTYELLNEHEKARNSYERAVKLQPRSALRTMGFPSPARGWEWRTNPNARWRSFRH